MDSASYAAASAGILQMRKLEVQNNNLANLNTVGFKGQYVVPETKGFDDTLANVIGVGSGVPNGSVVPVQGVTEGTSRTDFSLGPISNTGNPLDVALRGENEFFVVNSPNGPLYTRAGNFTLNQNGDLITQDGLPVQGDGGTINVQGADINIAPDGSVRANNQTVGRLQVVRFEDASPLERVEGARFRLPPGAPQPTPVSVVLQPQALEMSNVSAITGMVDLIATNRAFEAYTKAAQTIDQLNQTAINRTNS
jgi:flagellar basal-body rod protein FlgF